ncbi:MAG: flagellar FlbD family protein [Chitinivibrionales bacterium]|nr:flagellar FlbD family protein [Chitinivibrionales bacterium]
MIAVQRLNKSDFVLNADYIETVEATPDTVITLTNGKKYIVNTPLAEVIARAIKYKRMCHESITVLHRDEAEYKEQKKKAEGV